MFGRKGRYLELSPTESRNEPTKKRGKAKTCWRRWGTPIVLLLPIMTILALTLGLCIAGINFSKTSQKYGCDPNGNVWVTRANRPNLWAQNYGLSITMGFGNFPYSTAKTIDICWDLVVGRGAQVLFASIIYWVFRGPVSHSMQLYSVPYSKVLKMEYNTANSSSLWAYTRDIKWKGRPASQYFLALALALTTLYVLILPTWLSAITGYQTINAPLFQTQNDSAYISYTNLTQCVHVIHDGARVGLGNDACIPSNSNLAFATTAYINTWVDYNFTGGWTGNAIPRSSANKASTFTTAEKTRKLSPPLLNITQNNFQNPNYSVYYDGQMLSAQYLMEHSICSPQKEYSWGFSLILLFMFLAITFVFSILLYAIWLHSHRHAYSLHSERVFGSLRTAVVVTESVREELGAYTNTISDEGLKRVLGARGAGIRIRDEDDKLELHGRSASSGPRMSRELNLPTAYQGSGTEV